MERNPYAPPQSALQDPEPARGPEDELASRWARLGASLLDGLIMFAVFLPVLFLSDYWERAFANAVSLAENVGLSIGYFVLFCVVNGYLLATAGQTVGKRLVGTRVVGVRDGRVPALGTLLGRYGLMHLASAIPWVGGLFGLIDSLFVFREDKRCVHDLIAGTKVIKA